MVDLTSTIPGREQGPPPRPISGSPAPVAPPLPSPLRDAPLPPPPAAPRRCGAGHPAHRRPAATPPPSAPPPPPAPPPTPPAPTRPAPPAPAVAALPPAAPAGRADSGWIARRLLVALDRVEPTQHQQLYRAVGALHPDAVERLARADADPPALASSADAGPRLALDVLTELLHAGQHAPAAALADVLVRDFARRYGPTDPRTADVLERLLGAHRQLDALQLHDLLQRNDRLADTVIATLGPDHPATRSTEANLSRLRSMWARHRQFG
ncbi:MAG: hypothetical protein R2755_33790 [Acidimicrobiales bacterium]